MVIPRRVSFLPATLLAGAPLLLTAAPGGEEQQAPASAADTQERADAGDTVALGRQLIGEANPRCRMCHSIEGKGNPASVLDEAAGRLTRDEIKAWLRTPVEMAKRHDRTRKPAMVPFPEFSDEEVDAMATYLLSLERKAAGR